MSSPGDRSEWIRVSCATLCRIEHAGRFLLLINQNRRHKGLYVLSPIGGALQVYAPDKLAAFGAMPESSASDELRLNLPVALLPDFRTWFLRSEDRETSPFRELHEELVSESGLLDALEPDQVTCKYLWTLEEEAFTQRLGQTGLLTHYFLEVYDVTFTAAVLGPLLSPPEGGGAAWVTADQIERGDTITLHIDGADRDVRVRGDPLVRPPA